MMVRATADKSLKLFGTFVRTKVLRQRIQTACGARTPVLRPAACPRRRSMGGARGSFIAAFATLGRGYVLSLEQMTGGAVWAQSVPPASLLDLRGRAGAPCPAFLRCAT